jgi:DNA polymerase-4
MPRSDPWPRTILHVDLDAFYTSVHQRDEPELAGRPTGVAARSRRTSLLDASYEARGFGVQPGMPLDEALERCPDLVVVPPQHARYREASRRVHTILRRFTSPEKIEPVGLDAAYLDVTVRTRHGTSTPEDVVRRIKYTVHSEVGLTASVGAATSKLVARAAASARRPDGLVLVPPGAEADFLAPLPVDVVPGLGPRTEERLRLIGIRTVGELATFETARLLQALGTSGAVLQRLAQGRDRSPVEGNRPAKTISAEVTYERSEADQSRLEETLRELVDRVCERLRADGMRARTVYVKARLTDSRLITRQISRPSATDDAGLLFRSARAGLARAHLQQGVSLLGVGLSGLEHPRADPQLSLFD